MKNKLIYIGFSFQHHLNSHAGYSQIKYHLKYDQEIDVQSFYDKCIKEESNTVFNNLRCKIRRLLCWGYNAFPWYLFKCVWMALRFGYCTFHFIYPENTFKAIRLFHVRNCKVVLTLHQPYEWYASRPKWIKRLKTADCIIVLSNTELSKLKELIHGIKIIYLPHGISSDFYSPNNQIKEDMVLTVGNWLRDFKFADVVYQSLLEKRPNVKIVIVTHPANKKLITFNDNLTYLSGISDEELRDLYRKTSCLFLPLIRYTANNALLEAGSVGCPILIASNAADNSYMPNDLIKILPMSFDEVTNQIVSITENKENKKGLSDFVKSNYDWVKVAQMTKELLGEI